MSNVLIVDDHPSFRQGVKEILNEELSPIKFEEASGCSRNVGVGEAQEVGPFVMDVSMPGLTGPEALKAVKEIHPALPVLVLTYASGRPICHSHRLRSRSGRVLDQGQRT